MVELDECAWSANWDDEEAIDESTTVTTFEKFAALRASGDTGRQSSWQQRKKTKHTRVLVQSKKFLQQILGSQPQFL